MFPNKCKILQRFKLEGRNQENIGFWSMYMLILVRKHAKRVWFGTKSWCCGYFKSRGSRSILQRLDFIALINKYHQKSSSGQYTHVFFSGKSGWSSPKSWRFNPKRKDQQETYDFGQCACSSWPETCSKVRKHVWFGPKSWCDGGNILLIQPKKKTRSILQRFGRQGRDKYMFILLRRHASLVRKLMFDLVQIQSAGVENSYLLITKCRGSGFQL